MKAGKMDRRIILKRDSGTTRNALNEKVENFVRFREVWAEVRPVKGLEAIQNDRLVSKTTLQIFTRYYADVLVTDQIEHAGGTYQIEYVREIGRRDGLEIMAVQTK